MKGIKPIFMGSGLTGVVYDHGRETILSTEDIAFFAGRSGITYLSVVNTDSSGVIYKVDDTVYGDETLHMEGTILAGSNLEDVKNTILAIGKAPEPSPDATPVPDIVENKGIADESVIHEVSVSACVPIKASDMVKIGGATDVGPTDFVTLGYMLPKVIAEHWKCHLPGPGKPSVYGRYILGLGTAPSDWEDVGPPISNRNLLKEKGFTLESG